MAKFIVTFQFRDTTGHHRGLISPAKMIASRNMIVDAPTPQIAKAVAMNCDSYKKIARLHKKLWGSTKGAVRIDVVERESRWNNMK